METVDIRRMMKISAINITAAGTPQPNLGDAVKSSVYSNGISSIFHDFPQ